MARQVLLLALPCLLCALFAGGCVQDDGARWSPLGLIDEDQERELGQKVDRELQGHLRMIQDPIVTGFLHDLGQVIVRQVEPQPFIYRFRVVEDPSLNAFAVPGGYVYFHTGTLLAAGTLDELAGVMGHEVAHVKARHYAKMRQRSQLPDLLTNVAVLAVAVATGEPGVLITGMAANVALKLSFSRGYETEADQLGSSYMQRAGFAPGAIVHFFERILARYENNPSQLPPYLFTHPEVESRIESTRATSQTRRPAEVDHAELEGGFRHMQGRLAWLLEHGRSAYPSEAPNYDPGRGAAVLTEANRLAAINEIEAAIDLLENRLEQTSGDPRLHFRLAELLRERGRYPEAIAAFRRTIDLDPTRAQVFFQLGLSYKAIGDRQRAVYALEQALARAGGRGVIRQRAEWEVLKLNFGVVARVGFAKREPGQGGDDPAGGIQERFRLDDGGLVWWARLTPRFLGYGEQIEVRWRDPSGRVVQQDAARRVERNLFVSELPLAGLGGNAIGEWRVETLLRGDPVDEQRVHIDP